MSFTRKSLDAIRALSKYAKSPLSVFVVSCINRKSLHLERGGYEVAQITQVESMSDMSTNEFSYIRNQHLHTHLQDDLTLSQSQQCSSAAFAAM